MNPQEKLKEVFDSFLAKNPRMNFSVEGKVSDILLFRDYLATLKEVKVKLGITDFYISENLFHNLFLDMSLAWSSEIPSFSDVRNLLVQNDIDLFYFTEASFMGTLVYVYLCWEIFKDKEELIKASNGINPYRSAIKIIMGQHLIHRMEGFFYINDLQVFKLRYNKLPSLDDKFLRFVDTQCPVKKFGGTDVPNSDEVLQLWNDFNKVN